MIAIVVVVGLSGNSDCKWASLALTTDPSATVAKVQRCISDAQALSRHLRAEISAQGR